LTHTVNLTEKTSLGRELIPTLAVSFRLVIVGSCDDLPDAFFVARIRSLSADATSLMALISKTLTATTQYTYITRPNSFTLSVTNYFIMKPFLGVLHAICMSAYLSRTNQTNN